MEVCSKLTPVALYVVICRVFVDAFLSHKDDRRRTVQQLKEKLRRAEALVSITTIIMNRKHILLDKVYIRIFHGEYVHIKY